MNISALDIPLIRQDPKSDDTLRCCALMVFKYFRDSISKSEVWNKLHVYKKHSGLSGSYLADLGVMALHRGYGATISHMASNWWDRDTLKSVDRGKKELLTALKRLKKQKSMWHEKKIIDKEIAFIKAGGSFNISFPHAQMLERILKLRLPAIISARAENLYQSPKENYSHALVVIGKKGDHYLIRDPYLALTKVSQDELAFAWIRNSGWMLTLTPPKKTLPKPAAKQQRLKF